MSSTGRRFQLLLPLAVLLAVACVTGAAASPPTSASGTFAYVAATFNGVRMEGGNTIIDDLSATVSYSGTFSGTSTVQGTLILHGDGTVNFRDVETFTGTVNGVPGTVTFRLEGTTNRAGVVNATDAIVSATGGVAGLHGVLSLVGTVPNPNGPVGTYSGQIQSGSS
jgi:Protein of unknown function (DUF3224)